MTTTAKIKKYLIPLLAPKLEEYGFRYDSKEVVFYQKVNNIYQIISPNCTSSGNMHISAFCWVPEIKANYDMNDFPRKLVITNGGRLGEAGFSYGELWDFGNEEEAKICFDELSGIIDKYALPWFDTVNSRERLVEELFEDIKERPNFSEREQRILNPS